MANLKDIIIDPLVSAYAAIRPYGEAIGIISGLIGIAAIFNGPRRAAARFAAGVWQWGRHKLSPRPPLPTFGLRLPDFRQLVGRGNELATLRQFVASDESLCVVSGLGGVGKTALVTAFARELVRNRMRHVQAILYVTVDNDAPVDDVVLQIEKSLAVLVGKPEFLRLRDIGPAEARHAIASHLESMGPTLLIIDNWDRVTLAPPPRAIFEFGRQTKVLVTTRSDEPTAHRRIGLSGLSSEDAIRFAKDCVRHFAATSPIHDINVQIDQPLLEEAAESCGRNPLALQLVVPAICEARSSTDAREIRELVRKTSVLGTDLATHVARFTCARLGHDLNTRLPLQVVSLLPAWLTEPELLSICQSTNPLVAPNLRRLISCGVLETHYVDSSKQTPFVSVHPLVGEFLQAELRQTQDAHPIFTGASKYYQSMLSDTIGNPRDKPPHVSDYLLIERHIPNVLASIDYLATPDRSTALKLISGLGYFFRVRDYWAEADQYWSLGVGLATALGGTESQDAFRFHLYLSYMDVFRGRKHRLEARMPELHRLLLKRSTSIRRLLEQRDALVHEDTDRAYSSASLIRLIGLAEREAGRFAISWRFLNQALTLMRVIKSSPGIARTANDLADLVMAAKPDDARAFLAESREHATKVGDWIETARHYRLAGDLARISGTKRDAAAHYRKAEELLNALGLPDERFCVQHGLAMVGRVSTEAGVAGAASRRITLDNADSLAAWVDGRPRELIGTIARCIVLDWSGVLCDDLDVTRELQCAVIERHSGVRLSADEWRSRATPDWRSLFDSLISESARETAQNDYRRQMADGASLARMPLASGAEELLRELRSNGYLIALYSGQLSEIIEAILSREDLREFIDLLIADPTPAKPNPIHIQTICDTLQLPQSDPVIVDDMQGPLAMADRQGLARVKVESTVTVSGGPSGVRSIQELRHRLGLMDSCQYRARQHYERRYESKTRGVLPRTPALRRADNYSTSRELAKRCGPKSRWLDVGAGLATHALHADQVVWRLDGSLEALKRLPHRAVVANAATLPFRTGGFDGVLCVEVLEHLCHGDDGFALSEIARVLRPGGTVVLSVPRVPDEVTSWLRPIDRLWADAGHLREYAAAAISQALTDKGLRVVAIRSEGFLFLAFLLWLERSSLLFRVSSKYAVPAAIQNGFDYVAGRAIRLENLMFARVLTGYRVTAIAVKP